MWAELHARALAYTGDREAETQWLEGFRGRMGCRTCQDHWRELVRQMPPDLSADGYFPWTVLVHNNVSRRLGKRDWAVEDAELVHAAGATLERLAKLPQPNLDGRAA